MNPGNQISIIAPIALAVAAMLLSILVKSIMNSASFKRTNAARGHELFRVFFLGPDLALLAIGLFVSSQALRALLDGHNILTNFGDSFGTYFWLSIIGTFAFLLFSILCWLFHDDDERRFVSRVRREQRQDRNGKIYEVEVWIVDWSQTIKSRPGVWILIVGNFFGTVSVVAYASFIFLGFV